MQHLDVLTVYRDEAPGFLQRAAATGDPQAALAMYWALLGQSSSAMPGFETVKPDPVMALAYSLALRDIVDERGKVGLALVEGRLRRKLAAADKLEAERQSLALIAKLAPSRGVGLSLRLGGDFKAAEDCNRP